MLQTLFGFRGRLSRAGFIEALVSIVLVDVTAGLLAAYVQTYGLTIQGAGQASPAVSQVAGLLPWAFGALTVWAWFAASVKRCHDRGKSAWWLLLGLVPVVGWLWLLVELVALPGGYGRNKYGPQPHNPDPPRRWDPEPALTHPPVSAPSGPPAAPETAAQEPAASAAEPAAGPAKEPVAVGPVHDAAPAPAEAEVLDPFPSATADLPAPPEEPPVHPDAASEPEPPAVEVRAVSADASGESDASPEAEPEPPAEASAEPEAARAEQVTEDAARAPSEPGAVQLVSLGASAVTDTSAQAEAGPAAEAPAGLEAAPAEPVLEHATPAPFEPGAVQMASAEAVVPEALEADEPDVHAAHAHARAPVHA